jgi:hypothetical protein
MKTAYPINFKKWVTTEAKLLDPWTTPFLLVSNITKKKGLLSMGQSSKTCISRASLTFV